MYGLPAHTSVNPAQRTEGKETQEPMYIANYLRVYS